jgi:hypothetical protein
MAGVRFCGKIIRPLLNGHFGFFRVISGNLPLPRQMNLFTATDRDGPRCSGGQYAQVRVFDLKGEEGPISWVILVSYWTQLESWRGSTPGASYHDRAVIFRPIRRLDHRVSEAASAERLARNI